MAERRRDEEALEDLEGLEDHSDEDPLTRREALETELMERDESERGEEVGDQID